MKKSSTIASFLLFFILGTFLFSTTASAYIDPSTMTFIVQIIAGIVIAGAATFGFYFKKLKRKLKHKDDNTSSTQSQVVDLPETDEAEFDDSDIPDDEDNK